MSIEPVFNNQGVTIYACRWEDVIEQIDFDAIVTDPPYGMNYKGGSITASSISSTRKRFNRTVEGDDQPFDPEPFLKWPCCFTGAHWFYERLPGGGGWHTWNKRGEYKALKQADADQIWCSVRENSRVFNLVWRGLCRHSENHERIVHPTQKPVQLMQWMIGLLGVEDDQVIFDPFMGSGSTLVAASRLGIKAIGCEIVDEYVDAAINRLKQKRLF